MNNKYEANKNELKYMTLICCWKNLCSVKVLDFWRFLEQKDKTRNILVSARRVLGTAFLDLQDANLLELPESQTAGLTEDLQKLKAVSESSDRMVMFEVILCCVNTSKLTLERHWGIIVTNGTLWGRICPQFIVNIYCNNTVHLVITKSVT